MMEQAFFYFFAICALLAAGNVIISKHPVRSALSLMITFISTAILWLLLECEFLAFILVLIYASAIMVLFLFVIFMLDINDKLRNEGFTKFLPIGCCVAVLLLITLVHSVRIPAFGFDKIMAFERSTVNYDNTAILGKLLFTRYLFHFELAGILLLCAIIIVTVLVNYQCIQRKDL